MRTLWRAERIWTGSQFVTGLLVEDDMIVATGDAETLAAQDISSTEQLPGSLVVPGLHDAHIHAASLARMRTEVDVRGSADEHEAAQKVGEFLAEHPGTGILWGAAWDANLWGGRVPHRSTLDAVTGDRPVALASADYHSLWVNSAALRLAGYDRDTTDPAGGRLERDADGELTGVLRETACTPLYDIAPADADELPGLMALALDDLLAVGLTGITDIDHEDAHAAFRALHSRGELPLRVSKAIRHEDLPLALEEGRRTGEGDAFLRVGPLKLFADGALGSHTCHMTNTFAGTDHHGVPTLTPEQLRVYSELAVRAGIAVATHAIGDRASTEVIDAYEHVLDATGSDLRMRIEHAQHLQRTDLARMAARGFVASMQPVHCTSDFELVDTLLAGHDIVSYGWRSALDAGVPLAFGSDAPVEDANPLVALHAAVTRQRPDGTPAGGWQPHERITMIEALAAHSRGAAHAAGWDDVGALEPGMRADFIALETDIIASPETAAEAHVLRTVVGGQTRFAR
ncbi:amidohydrolase [Yimella sp. cx-573]|nr:amidohydrolase [Yimella sp. cx-573]